MAKISKTEREITRIKDEYDMINAEMNDFDISQHLAHIEDLPNLGEIELYDYETDLTVSSEQSLGVLGSLIDLYLGDVPELKEHPYIVNKMKEDAMVYSEAIFLSKMTRKSLLGQLRQVDNGDNSARMHEVVNQTLGQVRENAKFLSVQRTELEKFYKTLRKDLGHDDIEAVKSIKEEQKEDDSGDIMDNRKLNDLIKNAMVGKEDDRKKK